MDNHYRFRFCGSVFMSVLLTPIIFILMALPAAAQNFVTVGNQLVTASICTDKPAGGLGGGRFFISSGAVNGSHKVLYATTSNVIFRITRSDSTYLFTNAGSASSGGRPFVEGPGGKTPVTYIAYDSFCVSPAKDSAVITYRAVGYTIRERFFAEKQGTIYDTGGDIVIEFEWSADASVPPSSELGIFMMLDLYNGQAAGPGGSADYTSVLTNQGYFPVEGNGKLFTPPFDTIPDFYHAGNFLYQQPLNNTLPIHRLKGTTHGGLPLTPPDIFAIGDWIATLRFCSWDLGSADIGKSFHDCATAMRWEGLKGTAGKIRTAYGLDDRNGNNLFHCRDSALFIDVKTVRVIEPEKAGGPYTPARFDVEMWVTNTNLVNPSDVLVALTQPIGGAAGKNRLTLDPATPNAAVNLQIPVRATRHVVWTLDLAAGTNDTLLDIPLDFTYQYSGSGKSPRTFRVPCSPVVTIRTFGDIAHLVDRMPPVITRVQQSWQRTGINLVDRHGDYLFDTGIDSLAITSTENIAVTAPGPYNRCDTSVSLSYSFTVLDDTKPARAYFCAYDCRGNRTCDSVVYTPDTPILSTDAVTKGETGMAFTRSFPNPVSGALTVEYRLPSSGAIAMRLYDALGAQVRTVAENEESGAGEHIRVIDLSGLPSGDYRLVLTQHGLTASQPVKIVR